MCSVAVNYSKIIFASSLHPVRLYNDIKYFMVEEKALFFFKGSNRSCIRKIHLPLKKYVHMWLQTLKHIDVALWFMF